MPVGKGNLGDEALLASVIQNVRSRIPGVRILAVTGNPEDTLARHGVPAVGTGSAAQRRTGAPSTAVVTPSASSRSVRSALKRIPGSGRAGRLVRIAIGGVATLARDLGAMLRALDQLRGTHLLVIPGSGILADHFGGPMNMPWTLWRWCAVARLTGSRVAFLSVGAGPLETRLGRWFVKRSLGLSDYHSFRDTPSKRIIEELGVRGPNPLFPDLAHSLRLPAPIPRAFAGPAREIGVNPFPQFDPRYWPVHDAASYGAYVNALAGLCVELLRRGARLHLFPTQVRIDPLVVADLRERILERAPDAADRILMPTVASIDDLIAVLDGVDMVVATRFHGILLALMRARPVLGISNHHKMTELMIAVGLGDYVLGIDELDPQRMIERFAALESDRERIEGELVRRMAEFERKLAEQYDTALARLRRVRA